MTRRRARQNMLYGLGLYLAGHAAVLYALSSPPTPPNTTNPLVIASVLLVLWGLVRAIFFGLLLLAKRAFGFGPTANALVFPLVPSIEEEETPSGP